MKKFTKDEMAQWIMDNWKELLPILKGLEQDEIDRKERQTKFLEEYKDVIDRFKK